MKTTFEGWNWSFYRKFIHCESSNCERFIAIYPPEDCFVFEFSPTKYLFACVFLIVGSQLL